MGGSRCTICDHPERKAIETALAVSSERAISSRWHVGRTAVQRHRTNHVAPAVARAVATRADLSAEALVQRLADLLERCDRAMEKAENKNDLKALGGLIRESRELVVTVGRTVGMWTDKPSVLIDARRQTVNIASLSTDELRSLARFAADNPESARC
jgi:hypothetical protein